MKSKKIDSCEFVLEDKRLVFYPAEILRGELVLQLNQTMDTEAIEISLKGESETKWKETRYDEEQNPYEVEFESEEKVLKDKAKVFGHGDRETLPEGENRFPFSFQLPADLPPSYEGDYGHIRYSMKVKIKKSWKKDLKLKKMFVINNIVDVNQPKYQGGPGDNDEKTVGILCCASGPLTVSVNLDRGGYCPGDFILVTLNLDNKCTRELDKVLVELIQINEFSAKLEDGAGSSKRTDRDRVACIETGTIPEESKLYWKGQPLAIPPLPPTFKSKYIKVSYQVHICVEIPMAIDIDFNLPITIGSIPCVHKYNEPQPVDVDIPQHRPEPKAPKCGYCKPSTFGYNEMLPWLYSQVLKDKPKKMNDKDDKEKDYEDDKYIPIYTFAIPAPVENMNNNFGELERNSTPQEMAGEVMPPIE